MLKKVDGIMRSLVNQLSIISGMIKLKKKMCTVHNNKNILKVLQLLADKQYITINSMCLTKLNVSINKMRGFIPFLPVNKGCKKKEVQNFYTASTNKYAGNMIVTNQQGFSLDAIQGGKIVGYVY